MVRPRATQRARCRRIVRRASEIAEAPEVKDWLFTDGRGKWEETACDYLESTAEKARELDLPAKKVDEEIATMLTLQALEATLRGRKTKRKRKR